MTATRHGYINNDPIVFSEQGRASNLNNYGSSEKLGKSNKALYSNIFDHVDATQRQSESLIASKKFEGYSDLVTTPGDSENPDFENGTINYNYFGPVKTGKIGFYKNQEIIIDTYAEGTTSRLNTPPLYSGNEENVRLTHTDDRTGKFTPNLLVEFANGVNQDFSQYSPSSESLPSRASSGGGFGSEETIGARDGSRGIAGTDIHTNQFLFESEDAPTAFSKTVDNREVPMLTSPSNFKRGTLGQLNDENLVNYSATSPFDPPAQ